MMCHSRWKRSPSFLWEVHRREIGGQSPELRRNHAGKGRTSPAYPPRACHSVGRFSVNGSLSPRALTYTHYSIRFHPVSQHCSPRIQLYFSDSPQRVLTSPPHPELTYSASSFTSNPPLLSSIQILCSSRLHLNSTSVKNLPW